MQYKQIVHGETIIEFHNNWMGEETVIVNGKVVSKKSSVWGTNHYFTLMEDGHQARYILTTRVNETMQVVLDISRNGDLIESDIPVHYGTQPKLPANKPKKEGLAKLRAFELKEALIAFEKALKINPKDPEIYFHIACVHSVLEETKEGFEAIKKAVELGLDDEDRIITHEMLAFIRIHPAFSGFYESGFKEYEIEGL